MGLQPKFRDNRTDRKSYQVFKSCLTKDELIKLITEEIKLKDDLMINLEDIIDQASFIEATRRNNRLTKTQKGEQKKNELN